MDDEDDVHVEVVAVNLLDEFADSEHSEDGTSSLHNAQVVLLHSELVHQLHFCTRCKPFVVQEFVHWAQN